VYVAGSTSVTANPYPTTTGAFDETLSGIGQGFVSRLDADLTTLQASTFLGDGTGKGIEIDGSGRVYVTGTAGTAHPTTTGAYDETHNGSVDVFVSRLDADLTTLQASTFIGGSGTEIITAIALDGSGRVYVTGSTPDDTTDYPTTTGAYDETHNGGSSDVFVSRLDADLTTLQASTFIGGSLSDNANDIAIDGSGRVYVTGRAGAAYPTTASAYFESFQGIGGFAYVSRFQADLATLQASTLIAIGPTGGATGHAIAIGGSDTIYVSGSAKTGFPTTTGAYDETHNGGSLDVFVSRFTNNLLTSSICGISVDGLNEIYGTSGDDTLDGTNAVDIILALDGDDTVNGKGSNDIILGGNGNDKLNGNVGNDCIKGNDGNDQINGNKGDDTIDGGPGDDLVIGGKGNDTIKGGDGDDSLLGSPGIDNIMGEGGIDHIRGNGNNDVLNGGPDKDIIEGGGGADTMNGDAGKDIMYGGSGNDIINGGTENDILVGEGGADTMDGGTGTNICATDASDPPTTNCL